MPGPKKTLDRQELRLLLSEKICWDSHQRKPLHILITKHIPITVPCKILLLVLGFMSLVKFSKKSKQRVESVLWRKSIRKKLRCFMTTLIKADYTVARLLKRIVP